MNKRRSSATISEKTAAVERFHSRLSTSPRCSMRKFAREEGVDQRTFRRWVEDYHRLQTLSCTNGASKRVRPGEFEEVEAILAEFIGRQGGDVEEAKLSLSWSALRTKAVDIFREIHPLQDSEEVSFSASNGWLRNFLHRMKRRKYLQGSVGELPLPDISELSPPPEDEVPSGDTSPDGVLLESMTGGQSPDVTTPLL